MTAIPQRIFASLCLLTALAVAASAEPPGALSETAASDRLEAPRSETDLVTERALPSASLQPADAARLPGHLAARLKSRSTIDIDGLPSLIRVENGISTKMTTLLSTTFESSFPANWVAFPQGAADVFWGRSTFRASSSNASAWAAQRGVNAPGPGGNVPANTESWMAVGPFDLSSFSTGTLDFDLWLETEPGFDFFRVGASIDGTNFTTFGSDQDTNGFVRISLDLTDWGNLGDLTSRSQVFFAFIYQTDGSVTREGAYVDNVVLTGDGGSGGGGTGLNLTINQINADSCPQMQAIVSVLDDQGLPIPGLTQSNFTLSEDSTTQTIGVTTPGGGSNAAAVTLVLDGSGSLSNADIDNIHIAGNAFINLLAAGDRIAVYHFGSDVERVLNYTTDRSAARAAVDALDNNLGTTSLFDAIVDAANHSRTVSGRKALIVMTDGRNNSSSASQQDAIDAAIAAGVPVFTIGFGNANETVLMEIAQQTGGLAFQGVTSGDLQTIFQQVGQTLNSQLILTWTTPLRDGGVHTVDVTVRNGGQSATRSTQYTQANTPCANTTGACTPGPTTLCLNQDRFRVQVSWTDFQGTTGPGSVASCGTDDSGLFWFFDPNNWEVLIKVLNACGVNDRYWVFFAATTNVGYDLSVTDTQTGITRRYSNPLGIASPAVTDTDAFATCP
ncbi:MAG: VWA domain-containing protein [Acidobacteriota bacterium]